MNKKRKPMFQEYSKNLAKDFDYEASQCKTNKDIDKLSNAILPLELCSSDTVTKTWFFIKKLKIVILAVLL